MGSFPFRLTGWRRTAVYVAVFLFLWQFVDGFSAWAYPSGGITPEYPVVGIDVLLLIYVGWRWWPLIPISGVIFWALNGHAAAFCLPVLCVQVMVGIAYALAVRYVLERARIHVPLRTFRDIAWFSGVVGIGTPIVLAIAVMTVLVALGLYGAEDIAQGLSRFIIGDTTGVMALVPAVLTVVGWEQLRPTSDQQNPSRREIAALIAATALVVMLGIWVSSITREPVLDLAFVAMSWLAIRYGVRGAALATLAAYAATILMQINRGMAPDLVVQTQGFLFAAALMSFLLAAMTNERWELLARLARRAFVDELTGLPNRDRLVEWIERHQDTAIVLVIMDVDDMRLLNQGVGRVAADNVLAQMAIRMRATFPTSYMIARVSADEFAVAVVDDRSPHAIMSELRAFFDAPFDADGSRVFLTVSMGAVRMIRAGSADEMLRKADIALDHAKSSPMRMIVYAPDLLAGDTPSMVGELHRAAERGELVPFYQPIFRFDAASGTWQVTGAEALLRWIHPERGIVSPAAFIDLLERLAIGEHVGWNVMEQSLLQAGEWRREIPEFKVWVNLFARQVLARHCSHRIRELLERTMVPADALIVEINESVIAADEGDVANVVGQLREFGVHCAIDDFGTGGSSLGRVRDVPASVLKIDRSFVTKSEVDMKARAVAATVVRLATELGMIVVAEGVENTMQLEVMMETGAHLVQGYALGHPLPADLFARTFLSAGRASNL